MTVQDTPSEVTFVGNGAQTSFAFTFRVDDIAWLSVDFTTDFDQFTLNADQDLSPGGSVDYTVAPPNLQELTVTRLTPLEQNLDYTRYDPFDSESHEFGLDKLTMEIQDRFLTFANHIADLDIHFSDAPADGQIYVRRDNLWIVDPLSAPGDHLALINIGVNSHLAIDAHINNASIHFAANHTLLSNIGVNTHVQIDTHLADATIHFLEGAIDHANILNIGVNSHAAIDAHIADGTIHFTEASIDHTAISNIGVNSHAALDTHLADATIHFTEASIDHTAIANIGVNSHAAIDTHITDATIHFTEASIDHVNILNIGVNSHAAIDTHIADATIHPDITAGVNVTGAWTFRHPLQINSLSVGSTPPVVADNPDAQLRFANITGVTQIGAVGYNGISGNLLISNEVHGGNVVVTAETAAGAVVVGLTLDPDASQVQIPVEPLIGTGTPYTLPIADGLEGEILGTDGAGAVTFGSAQRRFIDRMESDAFVQSDFIDPPIRTDGLVGIAAGAGASISVPTGGYDFTNHPGVWGLNTGATAAGRVFLLSEFLRTLHVGVGGVTRFGAWYQVGAVLSDAANRYVLRAGFFSMALPNTILEGIGFEYQDDQNGGRWQGICEDGVAETSLDTGVLAVASTYYQLEIEINAAGTSVEFFIDKVSVGTIVTNIPSGTGFGLFVSIHIMKLTGVVNRAPYVDAYYLHQEVTR